MDTILCVDVTLKGRVIESRRSDKASIVIGRDPRCDVVIENDSVSREHARIERIGDELFVEDLQSANGTFVNETRVTRSQFAQSDTIQVGKFLLRITTIEGRRRDPQAEEADGFADAAPRTTVLSDEALERMRSVPTPTPSQTPHAPARRAPTSVPAPPRPPASVAPADPMTFVRAFVIFVSGVIVGAVLMRIASMLLHI